MNGPENAAPATAAAAGTELTALLERAFDCRAGLVDDRHESAFRALNGYREGVSGLVIDVYGRTAVLHEHEAHSAPVLAAGAVDSSASRIGAACDALLDRWPWLRAVVLKKRNHPDPVRRRGRYVYGDAADRWVRELGVRYAVDVLLNQDASFYVDTRHLRGWLRENLEGARVLNAFAYTGSLGVAAMAGGARRVVHLDLNRAFLNIAKTSYTLNGFPIRRHEFVSGDFFARTGAMKLDGSLFDCVIVDPPFFSQTKFGKVDLVTESHRILNKVRPLVADGGRLVAINNALFVPGTAYVAMLERLCGDGYMEIERFVDVPEDAVGYPETIVNEELAPSAPFGGPTKIAILRVRRKDGRRE